MLHNLEEKVREIIYRNDCEYCEGNHPTISCDYFENEITELIFSMEEMGVEDE